MYHFISEANGTLVPLQRHKKDPPSRAFPFVMVENRGLEPLTPALPAQCSTTELIPHVKTLQIPAMHSIITASKSYCSAKRTQTVVYNGNAQNTTENHCFFTMRLSKIIDPNLSLRRTPSIFSKLGETVGMPCPSLSK